MKKIGTATVFAKKKLPTKMVAVPIFTLLIVASVAGLLFCTPCFAGGFYRYNIDDLARKARQRIKEIERKVKEEATMEELEGVLAEIQPLFEEAESLFKVGKLEEAAELYREIDKLSKKKEVKKLLEKADKWSK